MHVYRYICVYTYMNILITIINIRVLIALQYVKKTNVFLCSWSFVLMRGIRIRNQEKNTRDSLYSLSQGVLVGRSKENYEQTTKNDKFRGSISYAQILQHVYLILVNFFVFLVITRHHDSFVGCH